MFLLEKELTFLDKLLNFFTGYFWIFLILAVILAFGIAGFYVDKNTNILEIEKKKKELREKSMNVEAIKNQIKNKNLSLGGTMGVKSGENVAPQEEAVPATPSNQEDLNAPLNLNGH